MLQKKIAVINDLAGYGRCALSISMPLLSAHGLQVCPVPTAVFSNHTAFPSCHQTDLTPILYDYVHEWEKLGLTFDGILSGYLSSAEQIAFVIDFVNRFRTPETVVVIDPVMGDHGKIYRAVTPEMCANMKQLVHLADVLTPNLTEACILTDTPYLEHPTRKELTVLLEKLLAFGAKKVVITGIFSEKSITNACMEQNRTPVFLRTKKEASLRNGTGDIFSSLLAADALAGKAFTTSVKDASAFIKRCIRVSEEQGIEPKNGVYFEQFLQFNPKKSL